MKTYIPRIEVYPVNKAEATAYLFDDGPMPDRYAQVNVNFGSIDPPKFVEYKVGPLHAAPELMVVTKISDQLWNSRPREGNEMRALKSMVDEIMNEADIRPSLLSPLPARHTPTASTITNWLPRASWARNALRRSVSCLRSTARGAAKI
jgi:hypothetical protein